MKFVDVLAPIPLENTFTYSIPDELECSVRQFCLVEASFGSNRYFTGLVTAIHDDKPDTNFEIKPLIALVDDRASVRPLQLKLWQWIASYYLCTIGDVFKAAMPSALCSLMKRNMLKAGKKHAQNNIDADNQILSAPHQLTGSQINAYNEIIQSFDRKDITLLHGVASGGKTEIYIHLIADNLARGKQILYLLPELAVTTQITERLRQVFGSQLIVYHSGCSDKKRAEVWLQLMKTESPVIVLGMRSAVFLPFSQLGLVIVDEEQEPSYKQQDPAPRYHARNVAMVLAQQHRAKVLLGSATPSLESYLWAVQNIYGLVRLEARFGEVSLPHVEIVDFKDLLIKRRITRNTLLSPQLCEKMQVALNQGQQVILFRNRRGFAPYTVCNNCGETTRCINCDVSLTYHKQSNKMICHYCGYSTDIQYVCSKCGSREMKWHGYGTEKIEEEVNMLFSDFKVARLDTDNIRTQNAYTRLLSDFEQGKTHILIGTQMITKGLDFANVSVIGILDADGLMNMPDFRAYERAFQLMLQAGGRAGRRQKTGYVIIQTTQPDNPLIKAVADFNYNSMAEKQLNERYTFRYPPYVRLIYIVLRYSKEDVLDNIAEIYYNKLSVLFGENVSAPLTPLIARTKSLHRRNIILKADVTVATSEIREKLKTIYEDMLLVNDFKKIILHYDVDPQ